MRPAIIAIIIFTLLVLATVIFPNSVPLISLIIFAMAWCLVLKRAKHEDKTVKISAVLDRGVTSAEQGDYRAAIKDFNFVLNQSPQMLKKFPHTAETYFNRGTAFYFLGNYSKAVEDYNQAINLKPKYVDAYFNRGSAYTAQNAYQEAIEDFNQAIRLNSKYIDIYNLRGIVLSYIGDNQGTLADFAKVMLLRPSASAYCNYATIQYLLGMSDEAISSFDEALKLDANSVTAYYCRGNIHYDLNNEKGAFEDYQRAITIEAEQVDKIDAQDEHGFYNRGLARYRIGDKELAIADMEQAIEICQRHRNLPFQKKVVATLGVYFKPGNLLGERDWDDVLFETGEPVEVRPYGQRPTQINQETHSQISAEQRWCHLVF